MKIITQEEITPEEDGIATIDFDNEKSLDIVSINKHVYLDYSTVSLGFEVFVFNRDGTGDYTPTGDVFLDIEEVRSLLKNPEELLSIMRGQE